jgi:hypothetical protein
MNFIFLYFEIAALIYGLIHYKRISQTSFGKLVWLIAIVVLAEVIGTYQRRVLHVPNVQVYNVATLIEFILYGLIFSEIGKPSKWSLFSKYFVLIYPIIWLVNITLIQGFQVFHTYTMSLGSFCMIVMSCFYFIGILEKEEKTDLLKSAPFWFASGILIFYSSDLFNSFFLRNTHKIILFKGFTLFKLINTILNIILYTCFIKVFNISKRINS